MDIEELDKQIWGEIGTSHRLVEVFRDLCLAWESRFSGSAGAAGAAAFVEGRLREYGVSHVYREDFPVTQWRRGTALLTMLSPAGRRYHACALPYSPSCDQEFILVDAGMGGPEEIAALGETVKGAAVLVDDRTPPGGVRLHRKQKYLLLRQAGAGAFLFVNAAPGMLAPTGSLAFNHEGPLDQGLPSLGLAAEVGAELRAHARKGTVRLRLVLENELVRGRDCTVVGDLRGEGGADHVTVVCGHYDGHDIAHGAADNASGTAAVLEIARVLAPLRRHVRGTVRFILFGSEEIGMVGSHAYVTAHRDDLAALRFVFNLDSVGSVGPFRFMLQNAPELAGYFRRAISSLPAEVAVEDRLAAFSDHLPFVLYGVPAAFMTAAEGSSRGWGHTAADTFEKVPVESLQRAAAFCARLALRVDQCDEWGGVVKNEASIKRALAPRQVEPLLRHEGHWPY